MALLQSSRRGEEGRSQCGLSSSAIAECDMYRINASQAGVAKLKRILEGEDEPQFDADLYMQLYT